MMKYKKLEEKIIKIVAEQFHIFESKISINSTFKEIDKNFDELDLVEIVMEIEDEFDISIEDEICDKWEKVEDIINYVSGKIEIELHHIPFTRFEIMEI